MLALVPLISMACFLGGDPAMLGAQSSTGSQATTGPASMVRLSEALVGRWQGSLDVPRPDLGQGREQSEAFSLRILPEGFVLVDFPERNIFGFPAMPVTVRKGHFSFDLGAGKGLVHLEGGATASSGGKASLAGIVSQGGVDGTWRLFRSERSPGYGRELDIAVPGGSLRGSLVLPQALAKCPLAILVSGSGRTDRDGNNYQVPGRNDSFLMLSAALSERGVASYRYDRRGVGESLALAPEESSLRFGDEVADLGAAVARLAADPRFSSIVLVGHSDGALVAASLLATSDRGIAAVRDRTGLAVLASGAQSALETFQKAIAAAPEAERAEGEAILNTILAGGTWPHPSPYYADFFRPSFQAYLTGWLNRDLKDLLPKVGARLLLVQGDRDMQVELHDFMGLAAVRSDAPALIIPDMNHVLKSVPDEVDANISSFSKPGFPVAEGLVAALVAFAEGKNPPSDLVRVDGGATLPSKATGSIPTDGEGG